MFVFNVPPTAKVIWGWGHGFIENLSDRLEKLGSNSGHLGTSRVVYPLYHADSPTNIFFFKTILNDNVIGGQIWFNITLKLIL